MPAIFIAHGSPFLLDDAEWVAELGRWAREMPRPKSVLMVSAHWEERPVYLAATRTVPLVYDFYGFPAKYYAVKYPAPNPVNTAVVALIVAKPMAKDASRPTERSSFCV